MSYKYKLKFIPTALKEWKKLDSSIQLQFKKKLKERLQEPHIKASHLSGFENHYKIKLRASGYRLVYEVIDQEICMYYGYRSWEKRKKRSLQASPTKNQKTIKNC